MKGVEWGVGWGRWRPTQQRNHDNKLEMKNSDGAFSLLIHFFLLLFFLFVSKGLWSFGSIGSIFCLENKKKRKEQTKKGVDRHPKWWRSHTRPLIDVELKRKAKKYSSRMPFFKNFKSLSRTDWRVKKCAQVLKNTSKLRKMSIGSFSIRLHSMKFLYLIST